MANVLIFFVLSTFTLIFLMVCAVLTAVITVSVLNHVAPPFPQWVVWLAALFTALSLTGVVAAAKARWSE